MAWWLSVVEAETRRQDVRWKSGHQQARQAGAEGGDALHPGDAVHRGPRSTIRENGVRLCGGQEVQCVLSCGRDRDPVTDGLQHVRQRRAYVRIVFNQQQRPRGGRCLALDTGEGSGGVVYTGWADAG